MIKKILRKIAASENPFMRFVTNSMSWPIRVAQLQLLKVNKNKSAIVLVQTIQKDGGSLMWPMEMIQIYNCVSAVKNLTGDFAEVGVYRGRSAKLICEIKGDRVLHLFDTFKGLPKPTSMDSNLVKGETFIAGLDSVRTYLCNYQKVIFHPGMFPETTKSVKNKSFAFAHLDVDLYQSTLDCLKFFYPRMVRGGIILSHDYPNLSGVKKAFDEFFADKEESVVELSTGQCLIIKNSLPRSKACRS